MSDEPNVPPHAPRRPKGQGCLRFVVWLVPIGITVVAGWAWLRYGLPYGVPLLGAIALTFGVGVFDGLLSAAIPKSEGTPLPKPLFLHATVFTLAQIVLIPALLAGLVYGACTLGSSGL